jgi:hypothetical protein
MGKIGKKIDSGKKGKSAERELVRILSERFGDGFSRSVGSGNRWGQVAHLPVHARETLTGDLCCPTGFRFVLECKCGYDSIDLVSALSSGSVLLNSFLGQVVDDSTRCGRLPLLLWKRSRRPWLAFVRTCDLPPDLDCDRLLYRGWSALPLDRLLQLDDSYFVVR